MSDLKKNKAKSEAAEFVDKICIHCGDPCGAGSVQEGNNYFCCPGCDTAFLESPDKYLKKMQDAGIEIEKVEHSHAH